MRKQNINNMTMRTLHVVLRLTTFNLKLNVHFIIAINYLLIL